MSMLTKIAKVTLFSICLFFGTNIGAQASDSLSVLIEMTDNLKYSPEQVTIQSGQTIIWKNVSRIVHTVTADSTLAAKPEHVKRPPSAQQFNSGAIPPGQSFSYKFTVPGDYRYFCIPHEMAGMIGSITVLSR